MKLRCVLFKHQPITVIDNIRLVDGVMWGECFSFGATVEETHKQCKRCGKTL